MSLHIFKNTQQTKTFIETTTISTMNNKNCMKPQTDIE